MSFKFTFYILHFTFYILILTSAYATPPMPGKPGRQIGPKDGVGSIWQREGVLTKGARKVLPSTTGEAKVIVLRIEFADVKLDESFRETENLMDKLKDYYQEVSYGQLNLKVTVSSSVYPLPKNMDYYGSNSNEDSRLKDLLIDAVKAADTDIDFSNYDAVIIYHAGFGEESSNLENDIWSVFLSKLNITTNDGVIIREGSVVAEKEAEEMSPLGVIAHEFGHQLGLPDLYNTKSDKSVIGSWCLMDAGAWNGEGLKPAHLCAWSKIQLGWIFPLEVALCKENQVYRIEDHKDTSVYKIMIKDIPGEMDEYFLVSNRQRWGYDSALPKDGLLIWHIDDNMGSIDNNDINNYYPKRVYLENGAPFHKGGKDAFTPYTNPNSDANNGTTTGISLEDISSSNEVMTMYVYIGLKLVSPANGGIISSLRPTFDWEDMKNATYTFQLDVKQDFLSPLINEKGLLESKYTPSFDLERIRYYWRVKAQDLNDITKESSFSQVWAFLPKTNLVETFVYPNPTYDGEATIQFTPSSLEIDPEEVKISIYDISGELVLEASSLKQYEYHFDGRNKAGKKVASGIYIYCVKYGQETECGKMAVKKINF